jgi:hypothetical protein
MAEVCDPALAIQRVIDEKFPNTRLTWQTLQAQYWADRASGRFVGARARTLQSRLPSQNPSEPLDIVAQRLFDNRYPDARQTWLRTREDPAWAQSAGLTSRSLGTTGLPALAQTSDPRWAKMTATRTLNLRA